MTDYQIMLPRTGLCPKYRDAPQVYPVQVYHIKLITGKVNFYGNNGNDPGIQYRQAAVRDVIYAEAAG